MYLAEALAAEGGYKNNKLHLFIYCLQASPLKPLTTSTTIEVPCGNNDSDQFHPREFRKTVTKYIQNSFDKTFQDSPDLLYAWQILYQVVHSAAVQGWVHRDLLWSNVRTGRHHDSESPVFVVRINFDLAAGDVGASIGSPDKIHRATVVYAYRRFICYRNMPVRRQEPHEYEAMFWIEFVALISRSRSGKEYFQLLRVSTLELEQLAKAKAFMIAKAD